jgi:signal transduction histidine kinase
MKLEKKMMFSFLTAMVISTSSLIFVFYTAAKSSMQERIYEHLKSIAESKASWINYYFAERKGDTLILAKSPLVKQILAAGTLGPETRTYTEDMLWPKYLRDYKKTYDYCDLLLISPEGDVWWTAETKSDLGTNLNTGSYKNTNLAKLFRLVSTTTTYDAVEISDYEYYSPSNGPAAFIVAPVRNGDTLIGIMALQISTRQINEIMQERTGLGQTGETYLVGQDLFMRSDSRFSKESSVLKQKVDTMQSRLFKEQHIFGKLPAEIEETPTAYPDYRGIDVLGAHTSIPSMGWALLAEIDKKEAFAPLAKLKAFCIIGLCTILTIVFLISILISKAITGPIHRLHRGTEIIGEGNLDHKVGTDTKDEIGQLSRAFDQMTSDLKENTTSIDNLNREIAYRKQTEKDMEILNRDLVRTVDKLEETNCKLTDFVYIASHDLREPLRKISSFGRLLKQSLEGSLDNNDKENLEFMVDGADRMTEMIEGLLTYSRVDTQGAEFETVDLNEIIEQLRQLELADLLEKMGGTIEVAGPLPEVQADPTQIRQLLQNIIINGLKYRQQAVQPQIVIRARQTEEDTVRIEVQDNGIGIDEKYHGDIFTMFRRLHSRRKYDGTGIGLSVCKKIVERHNGLIGVESKIDEGSTFWFTLSKTKETAAVS